MTSRSDSAAPLLLLFSPIGNWKLANRPLFCLLLMVPEEPLRQFARKGDAFHDMVMMALLRQEWSPAQRLDRRGASVATQMAPS